MISLESIIEGVIQKDFILQSIKKPDLLPSRGNKLKTKCINTSCSEITACSSCISENQCSHYSILLRIFSFPFILQHTLVLYDLVRQSKY